MLHIQDERALPDYTITTNSVGLMLAKIAPTVTL
jgi:hypothetical protein